MRHSLIFYDGEDEKEIESQTLEIVSCLRK